MPENLRGKGEAPQSGTYTLSNAQLASQTMIPPCPNKLRVKGESPQLGTYTLSNAQLALSCGGESKGRAPPIGRSCTLESQIGLSQRECKESPPNWEVMHLQTAQLALSCICNSKISAIEK